MRLNKKKQVVQTKILKRSSTRKSNEKTILYLKLNNTCMWIPESVFGSLTYYCISIRVTLHVLMCAPLFSKYVKKAKLPLKSKSSKIEQNHNISYKPIKRWPKHFCWLWFNLRERFFKYHDLVFRKLYSIWIRDL